MNRLSTIILTLLLIMGSSLLNTVHAETPERLQAIADECLGVRATAHKMMGARQLGIPKSVVMDALKTEMEREVARRAYELPQFANAESVLAATERFEVEMFGECLAAATDHPIDQMERTYE